MYNTTINKLSKVLLLLLACTISILVLVNIIYSIYDRVGYKGPPVRASGDVNRALVTDILSLGDEYSIDLSIPCDDVGVVELVLDKELTVYRWPSSSGAKELEGGILFAFRKYVERHWYSPNNIEIKYPAGSIISPSLISGDTFFVNAPFFEKGWRKVLIWNVEGVSSESGRTEGYVRLNSLRDLYYDYLIQNNLEGTFEQITGSKLTKLSATNALLAVDKQLFEQNVTNSPDYKFSPAYIVIDNVCFYGSILLILLNIMMIFVHRRQWQKEERDKMMNQKR